MFLTCSHDLTLCTLLPLLPVCCLPSLSSSLVTIIHPVPSKPSHWFSPSNHMIIRHNVPPPLNHPPPPFPSPMVAAVWAERKMMWEDERYWEWKGVLTLTSSSDWCPPAELLICPWRHTPPYLPAVTDHLLPCCFHLVASSLTTCRTIFWIIVRHMRRHPCTWKGPCLV